MSIIIQLTHIYLEASQCQVRNLQFSWGRLDGLNKKHLNMEVISLLMRNTAQKGVQKKEKSPWVETT